MIKLYPHQQVMLDLISEHPHFALFAEQGCGKTIPMLIHISDLLVAGEIKNALVVAPPSALGAWQRDIQKLTPFRRKLMEEHVAFTNYHRVWRKVEYDRKWDLICLDEAHCIAHNTSKRTKFFIGYKAGRTFVAGLNVAAKYRYLLTGTPVSNGKLEQYYSLLTFLEPNLYTSYNEFRRLYLIEKTIPNTHVSFVVGYVHKEELLDTVGRLSYRITKKECLTLPEKMDDEIIYCPLGEIKLYKQALKNFMQDDDLDLEYAIPNPLTRVAKLRQIPNGFITDEYGDVKPLRTYKLDYLDELIDSIGDKKIVIYAYYTTSIHNICDLLTKKNLEHIVLNGEQKDKTIWKKFQEDESIRVIVCQYASANSGIDLFKSSYMIFYEPDLSTTVVEQSRDRIHRIGQTEPCSYYWLITENTIEESIYKRLKNKQDFNEECLQYIKEGKL